MPLPPRIVPVDLAQAVLGHAGDLGSIEADETGLLAEVGDGDGLLGVTEEDDEKAEADGAAELH